MNASTINSCYPISKVDIYEKGLVLRRETLIQDRARGERKSVTQFSKSSYIRLAFLAAHCPVRFLSMLTLTYGEQFPNDGGIVKKQLQAMMIWLVRRFGRYSYIWFLEFQRRGAMHIHLLTTLPVPGENRRRMMCQKWVSIQDLPDWPYSRIKDKKLFHVKQSSLDFNSHPTVWEAIKNPEGDARYAVKYATKPNQKKPPTWVRNVGRFWGMSGDCRVSTPLNIVDTCEDDIRTFLRAIHHPCAEFEVLPKYLLRFDKS
jgi:hypothetical protein